MKKQVWNQKIIAIIIGASGTLLAALVIYLLGYLVPVLGWLSAGIISFWKYFKSPLVIPMWLFWLLILGSIATIFRILKSFLTTGYSAKYRRDEFFELVWRWSYPLRPAGDRIWCFCPKCETRLIYRARMLDGVNLINFFCETCNKEYPQRFSGEIDEVLSKVIRQIDRKIRTGDWKSVKQSA